MVVASPDAEQSVGILQCGEVPESLSHAFVDYNEMIAKSLIAADPKLTCRTWRVFEGEIPEPNECDAWVTTGSRHSVNDENDWTEKFCDFVKVAAEKERPFIGICYGMQMMARALGGRVEFSQRGWGVGVATSSVYEQPAWMSQAVDELNLVVSHQEQVITLPENATLVAGSDFCPHSIFSVGQSMLGIQGHPEFTTEYSRALMEARREIIPADRVSEGMDSLAKPVHGGLTFEWIVKFIREALSRSAAS